MSVSAEFQFIGEQALTLSERLTAGFNINACLQDSPEALFSRWSKTFSSTDQGILQRRLKWDGLTEETVICGKMGQTPCGEDFPWLTTLISATGLCSQVLEDFRASNLEELSWIDTKQQILLCELWLPFVRFAKVEVGKILLHPDSLGEQAWHQLQIQLICEIASTGEQALYRLFSQFRSKNNSYNEHSSDRSLLDQFIIDSLQNQLIPIFKLYPVLARQVCRLTDTWIESVAELLNRLHLDHLEISQLFNGTNPLGVLEEVKPALSDRHDGGRRVAALRFSSGLMLIYKPRSVSQEYAFNQLICWLKEQGLDMTPPNYQVLDKSTYGWVSYVRQQACESELEVREYFYKSGMLTALIYIFNGNDCHMDNLIATRDGPMLIDLESLLQPRRSTADNKNGSAFLQAQHQLDQSVLTSGLLQYLCVSPDGSVTDASGFRGKGNHISQTKQRFWAHNNSDAVVLKYRSGKVMPMQNLVFYHGRVQVPEDHIDALSQGFNTLYRFVQQAPKLIQTDEPLQWFRTACTRIIFRPSNDYALLLHALISPRFQKNGLDRSFMIESMGRVFAKLPDKPALWSLHRDEKQCLEDLDIPYFSLVADSRDLISRNGECNSTTLIRSGYDDLLQRLNTLNEKDRLVQDELIRSCLTKNTAHELEFSPISSRSNLQQTQALSDDEVLHHAENIANQIWTRAIRGTQGDVTWLSPAFSRREDRRERGAAYYLYSGGCGIALFQAALARVTGRQKYRRQVEASVKPVSILLESESIDVLLQQETLGICNGIGSIVYSLLCIGQLLNDESYIDLATRMAVFISSRRITQDQRLDVEGGCAGAILALTALYQHSANPLLLKQAQSCGQHLLAQHQQTHEGWGWLNDDGLMLAGLAHGAGGVALAFLRLYQQCSEQRYLDAAIEAICYEDSLFCTEKGNWPVLTKDAETEAVNSSISMTTWCHGAPGIALSRLDAVALSQHRSPESRFETAVKITRNCDLTTVDHLCCGNMGRADSLLTLGLVLSRQELRMEARLITTWVIRRMQQQGHFRIQANSTQGAYFNPGFFRGLSGIGYTLLRTIEPQYLPSILQFNTVKKPLYLKESYHA